MSIFIVDGETLRKIELNIESLSNEEKESLFEIYKEILDGENEDSVYRKDLWDFADAVTKAGRIGNS